TSPFGPNPDRSTPTATPSLTSALSESTRRSRACNSRNACAANKAWPRIKRPMVAGFDAVEAACLVRDHAREHIKPPGRALRVGGCRNFTGQSQAFLQRHDVDAAGFENRAV